MTNFTHTLAKPMASRWRIWDRDFATEVLENNLPVETMKIMPVGGRGRVKLNIPPNLLNLPILSSRDKALPVSGRGRSLVGLKQTVPDLQLECQGSNRSQRREKTEESLKEFANRISKSRLQNEKEWPSLGKAKQTGQSKNDGIKNKKKVTDCGTIHNEKDMNQGTNSLSVFNNENNNTHINGTLKRPTSVVSCQFEDCEENFVDFETENWLAATNITSENISCTSSDLLSDSQNLLLDHVSLTGDYTDEAFLKTLDEPEKYILIQNVPIDVNEDTFQETISSFGDILVFLPQVTKKRTKKVALVKMDTSSHCDWVISCLDGSTELSDERLLVQKVKNLVAIEEEND